MLGSTLYKIPHSELSALPDQDLLEDLPYDKHEVEVLDFGYWELFARELSGTSIFGDVVFHDHPSGSFAFAWSIIFLESLLNANEEQLRTVAEKLLQEPSSAGLSPAEVVQECRALKSFFAGTRSDQLVVVEIAPQA